MIPEREKPEHQLFLFLNPSPSQAVCWLLTTESWGVPFIRCPEQQLPGQAEDSHLWTLLVCADLVSELTGHLGQDPAFWAHSTEKMAEEQVKRGKMC